MLRGTRIIFGQEATRFIEAQNMIRNYLLSRNYNEIVVPSIWELSTFQEKVGGSEVLNQMWTFKDRGDRDVCLIPEVTGIIQQLYRESWEQYVPKPIRLFYVSRCYRYDRPQRGRYREFTQIGLECLGPKVSKDEVIDILQGCLDLFKLKYNFVDSVKRGLTYYVEDGFEVECQSLGAQKQIAGGGRYAEGIGWAIDLDRLLLGEFDV